MVGTESVRSISSATQSSDVQSFRSASGSSVLYSTGKRFQGTKLISEGNNSIDETCKAGPLVVRDTYQNIGIKTEKSILALGSKLAHDVGRHDSPSIHSSMTCQLVDFLQV